jgi:hypothetical protein
VFLEKVRLLFLLGHQHTSIPMHRLTNIKKLKYFYINVLYAPISNQNYTGVLLRHTMYTIESNTKYEAVLANRPKKDIAVRNAFVRNADNTENIQFKFFHLKRYLKWNIQNTYTEDVKMLHLFNSFITDSNNIPLSIGTPQAMDNKSFCRLFNNDFNRHQSEYLFRQLVEGTEINMFFHNNRWQFATKYKLAGAKTTSLFLECAEKLKVNLDDLDKTYCYNFVFQHPTVAYVHKFIHHAIYLINTFKIDSNLKCITQKYNNNKIRGVKTPNFVIVNHANLDLILREWKGTLPKHVLENDPYEGKYYAHMDAYKGISITHMHTGIFTTAINYHFKGKYRKINGCDCCPRKACTCKNKDSFMDKSMSGNISKAFNCPETCNTCKFNLNICQDCVNNAYLTEKYKDW